MHRALCIFIVAVIVLSSGCTRKYRLDRKDFSAENQKRMARSTATSSSSSSYNGQLDLIWETRSSGKPVGPLSIFSDNLIVPDSKKRFQFFALKDGQYQGKIPCFGNGQTGMTIADSLAFFAVGPGKSQLISANLFNGRLGWRMGIKDATPGSIIVDNGLVLSSTDGAMVAVDRNDGTIIWEYFCDQRLAAPPSIDKGLIFQPGDQGRLYVLSADDGIEAYRTDLEGPIVAPVVFDRLAFVVDVLGNLFALDPADGKVIWRRNIGGPVWAPPSLENSKLVMANSHGEVLALEKVSGDLIWRYDVDEAVRNSPIIVGDYVIAATTGGTVISLGLTDGNLVNQIELDGSIDYTPMSDGTSIYLATDRGYVICLGDTDGKKTTTD